MESLESWCGATQERRQSTRLYGSYPARVRGWDQRETRFESTTLVDNISSGGLFLQLNRSMGIGSKLFVVVSVQGATAIAALGTVVRTERRAQGLSGVAVRFSRSRVLMSAPRATGKSGADIQRN